MDHREAQQARILPSTTREEVQESWESVQPTRKHRAQVTQPVHPEALSL